MNSEIDFSKKSVCVVGAGASGLCAAHLLNKYKFNVTVLEASDIPCGRIKGLKNFCSREIELGGEEIHGDKTLYYRLAKEAGAKIFCYWEENTFYTNYGGEYNELDKLSSKHPNLKFVWDLFEEASYEHQQDYPDISVKEYLKSKNIPDDLDYLANAMFAVECGTDLSKLSMGGFSSICKKWQAGEENYLLSGMSHSDILKSSFSDILGKIAYKRPVTKIEIFDKGVIVEDASGKSELYNHVIITVPVTQIPKIKFVPELSPAKRSAFSKFELDNVAKLVMKFRKPFWPENCSWLLLPGSINVFWPVTQGEKDNEFVLTGMTSGEQARTLNRSHSINRDNFIISVISEMEKATGKNFQEDLIDFYWFDWKDVPYIEGGYTYPVVGEGDSRDIMRTPIEDKVFFAGEAYGRNGHIATIHGAIETAEEAVESLVLKLKAEA